MKESKEEGIAELLEPKYKDLYNYLIKKYCDCRIYFITGFSPMSSTGGENWCAYCGKRRW